MRRVCVRKGTAKEAEDSAVSGGPHRLTPRIVQHDPSLALLPALPVVILAHADRTPSLPPLLTRGWAFGMGRGLRAKSA